MISYTRLKSGDWGVKGPSGEVREGATVTVIKKNGETKQETIEKVLFSRDGIALAAIKPRQHTRGGCACTEQGCCRPRCQCDRMCVCRGGTVFDCMG